MHNTVQMLDANSPYSSLNNTHYVLMYFFFLQFYINIFIYIYTYQSSLDELFLACLSILLLTAPGFEGRGLQGTAI